MLSSNFRELALEKQYINVKQILSRKFVYQFFGKISPTLPEYVDSEISWILQAVEKD